MISETMEERYEFMKTCIKEGYEEGLKISFTPEASAAKAGYDAESIPRNNEERKLLWFELCWFYASKDLKTLFDETYEEFLVLTEENDALAFAKTTNVVKGYEEELNKKASFIESYKTNGKGDKQ